LSSAFQEKHDEVFRDLARELRQFNGLSASFFRAAAARSGINVTDMQVIDILHSTGPMTAGQLAELTGLTTGAITGMLNRLEESGLVHRERDPEDGRRVIVQLAPDKKEEMREINAIFDAPGRAWNEMASHYDDEQIAFLLEFLARSNAMFRREIVRLREAPEDEGEISAPLGGLESARLVVSAGVSRLTLRAGEGMSRLYQARFEGSVPDVKVKDGVVTIRYPRRLLALVSEKRAAEVTLSTAIPWQIVIQGGAATINAKLGNLDLAALEIKGGLGMTRVELPVPSGVVPIRISGSASEIIVRRPAGVAARVRLKGWASTLNFDDLHFSDLGNDMRLQSTGFDLADPYYDIEVASSVSTITITTKSIDQAEPGDV
jgi:DNA-binding MarR family transcriptional regulator